MHPTTVLDDFLLKRIKLADEHAVVLSDIELEKLFTLIECPRHVGIL